MTRSASNFSEILGALAALMLREGITAAEFGSLADIAFIKAARDKLMAEGIDPSYSRIAAITGIHRHAVSTVLNELESKSINESATKRHRRHRLDRVLSGWFEDPRYTDSSGNPKEIPLDGPHPSFSELVRSNSGDIYHGIVLDELQRVGAIETTKNGELRAVSRRFVVGGADANALHHADEVAGEVLRTLIHNLFSERDTRLFEDEATTACLPAEALPQLRKWIKTRATALLDDLQGWLDANESPMEQTEQQPRLRAGLRIIMVKDDNPEKQD
ncbi:MAG: DUF6502 family protein [Steroidobacteraceae bacterium]